MGWGVVSFIDFDMGEMMLAFSSSSSSIILMLSIFLSSSMTEVCSLLSRGRVLSDSWEMIDIMEGRSSRELPSASGEVC